VTILAIDPGTEKCGVAMIAQDMSIIERRILSPSQLEHWVRRKVSERPDCVVVLGEGTGRSAIKRLLGDVLQELGKKAESISEKDTSQLARVLYFELNPPRGWKRLLPVGLRIPPEPYDDLAAVIIGRRYIESLGKYRVG
jgi:RNase H-fold protein (predicted Holliday junction resolvase)